MGSDSGGGEKVESSGTAKKSSGLSKRAAPRSKPPSNFLCRVPFRVQLPDPPLDCKLLAVTDTKDHDGALRALRFSSLDAQYQREYAPGPLAGMRIHLSALSQYSKAPEITSVEDDELLTAVETELSLQTKRRKMDYGNFLRPTQYDEYAVQKAITVPRQIPKPEEDAAQRSKRDEIERTEQLKRTVLHQFDGMKHALPSRHPCKKNAMANPKPIRSFPVLPDFSLFHDKFVGVQFDEHPLKLSANRLKTVDEDAREKLERKAIAVAKGGSVDYVAYSVPVEDLKDADDGVPANSTDASTLYETLREFEFVTRTRAIDDVVANSYIVVLGETCAGSPIAQFCEMSSRMMLHKKVTAVPARADGERRAVRHKQMLVERCAVENEDDAVESSVLALCTPLDLLKDAAQLEDD